MAGTNLFNATSADAVKQMIGAWPDAIEREDERKGENYWKYFERKRAGFNGTFSFGISGISGADDASYLAITFAEGGTVTSVTVVDRDTAIKTSKIAMEAKLSDWEAILEGYDIGKAMTYHMLPLTKGSSLDLLRCVYFLHELIIVLTRAEASALVAA